MGRTKKRAPANFHGVASAGEFVHAKCMNFAGKLSEYRVEVESALGRLVPAANTRPQQLHAAMRYSLEAGGKRVRPVLALAAAELLGGTPRAASAVAAALECVHTYSLVHDDLPCMDDDDLRRGRPTVHKVYDEATALLAGDALLTLAFQILAREYSAQPALAAFLVGELSTAAGSEHLIGGQMADLLAEERSDLTADDLEFIHVNKTGALICSALVMGGATGIGDDSKKISEQESLPRLRRVGHHLGLAFQITDDILDATADAATLGKTPARMRGGQNDLPENSRNGKIP